MKPSVITRNKLIERQKHINSTSDKIKKKLAREKALNELRERKSRDQ